MFMSQGFGIADCGLRIWEGIAQGTKVSVFPAAASLQTGSSTGFSKNEVSGFSVQVSDFLSFFPDT
jgi:hypothetical protein